MKRDKVLWFGRPSGKNANRDFTTRGLTVEIVGDGPLPDFYQAAQAAVFVFTSQRDVARFAPVLSQHAAEFADYGIAVIASASTDALMADIENTLKGSEALSVTTFRTEPADHRIAEDVARHDAGPIARADLEIESGEGVPPIDRDTRLLRRAFHDCSRIDLVELGGGRSGAKVYAVYMTVAGSDAGKRPQPAFVKIGPAEKIEVEFKNYQKLAERYVPFGMRPNLKLVIRGYDRGLLMGDFVEGSQSLWDLARCSAARQAIHSLLEGALASWRDQRHESEPTKGSVAAAMEQAGLIKPDRIKEDYATWSSEEKSSVVWDRLQQRVHDYRTVTVHGDLSGENVRVRDNTAILIDFGTVCRPGPATTDLACLEVWLAFQVPPGMASDTFDDPHWLKEIERLYASEAFRRLPGPCDAASRLKWIWDAIRPIRQAGLMAQTDGAEYRAAVAVQLLRRCQWEGDSPTDRFRRAEGYRIAAGISRELGAI